MHLPTACPAAATTLFLPCWQPRPGGSITDHSRPAGSEQQGCGTLDVQAGQSWRGSSMDALRPPTSAASWAPWQHCLCGLQLGPPEAPDFSQVGTRPRVSVLERRPV